MVEKYAGRGFSINRRIAAVLLRCCSIAAAAAAAAAGQTDNQTGTMLYAKCALDAAGVRRK